MEFSSLLIVAIFILGYIFIIFEHSVRISKTAIALLVAGLTWAIYFVVSPHSLAEDLLELGKHVSQIAQIVFFLMGAMTIVELIDSHKGFRIVTDLIHTTSKRKMMWLISFIAFFLSSVLDNLTTTILMVSLLRKLIPQKEERLLLCCCIVIAANAGGAWTPIGDVTTTMLWINGQLSSFAVMKALFVPSLISLLIPLCIYSVKQKGKYPKIALKEEDLSIEPGGAVVFYLGICSLIFVPIFKAWTGLPPFMGVLIGLAVLWLVTDLLHEKFHQRQHLRIPTILTKIDTTSILFFLGILLCVDALETAGILRKVATFLDEIIPNQSFLATVIGLISAVIDNVPLVAATMGMYSLEEFPMDAPLWHMIAYAAGTGGSLLLIGSSSGVALMGMEKIDFFSYMRRTTLPALAGYLIGMFVYVLFCSCF